MLQILNRRTKNNPVIIGEAGVGKTAIAEALAQRMAADDVPDNLARQTADVARHGRAARGRQVPRRVRGAAQVGDRRGPRVPRAGHPVHRRAPTRSSAQEPPKARSTPPTCSSRPSPGASCASSGATTLDEYRKHIEKDAALERRFAPVYLDEPSTDDAIQILTALKPRYESHHGVTISEDAIQAAVRLSQRYLTERRLPDKAIDLIDEAASRLVIDNPVSA